MFFHLGRNDDLVLGSIDRFGFTEYRLPQKDRAAHMYVIGITGKGKSKLLEHCLFQDIVAGSGCGLLDPHSDLANDVISYLVSQPHLANPKNLERIIYFDPTRRDYLIPFNVLKGEENSHEKAEQVIEAFRRAWPETLREAPRFSQIARSALLVLIENNLTLMEMQRLLVDRDFREGLLANVSDYDVVSFFHDEYDRWGRERPLMIESLLNKVTAFTFNPQMKLILGSRENRLDLKRIMDEGKVLIIDLGGISGETQRLLGSLITVFLEQAALSRRQENRSPFYFYIDEFQSFVAQEGSAKTLAQILSQSRKFGLHLILAHQTLGQIEKQMKAALGNMQTKIVFGLDREDAEIMAKKLGEVDTERIKHESQTEVQHPVYSPLVEQWEEWTKEIQALPPRYGLVKSHQRPVARIKTITVQDRNCTRKQLEEIKAGLARKSGLPCHVLRREVEGDQEEGPVYYEGGQYCVAI